MTAQPDGHHRPVGQLTIRELDLYGTQLARCLKTLELMPPSAPSSSANWPRSTPNSNHAPQRASPSIRAALAMSAG